MDEQKTVIVTGASSGIGAATAERLARQGHHVVLAARRADRMAQLVDGLTAEGFSAEARELNVTDRAAFEALVADVIAVRGRLDVLVANAGVMLLSRLDALLVDEWQRMFEVNVTGLLNGIAAALPRFTDQGGGHFVTVASIGAHSVVGTSAVYSGTKYAAWAITEGLRQEVDPFIRVTTISPGVVETELATHITDPDTRQFMNEYRRNAIPADAIARAIAYAINEPSDVDVNEIVVRPTGQRP